MIFAPGPQRRSLRSRLTRLGVSAVLAGIGIGLFAGLHAGRPRELTSPNAAAAPPASTADPVSIADADLTLPVVDCTLPRFATDRTALRAYYEAALKCLDDAWRPALEQAHVKFVTAQLDSSDDIPATTPCGPAPGVDDATALYCGTTRMIYMPRSRLLAAHLSGPAQLAVLAHEYGHHVQRLAGLLDAAGDDPESSRRVELQANCYAGLFAESAGQGTLGRAAAELLVRTLEGNDDSDSHGSGRNQSRWTDRGYHGTTKTCDTWSAPAADVA